MYILLFTNSEFDYMLQEFQRIEMELFLFNVECLFSVCMAVTGTTLGCDSETGPVGLTQCFLGTPFYTKYQYGTCLSDAYIMQKSNGKHHCRNRTATYCYYPCMIEKYEIDRGPVYDECICDTSTQLQQPPVILPAACYNPAGMDCNWYRQCLARMFNCPGPREYAVSYGEKFCNLYEQSKSQFSQEALQWLDAARKCLQVALVPALHLNQLQPTCEDIKTKAFESHVRCYIEPGEGFSVCSLSVQDWINIFLTIRGSFMSSAWLETLKATVRTAAACVRMYGQLFWTVLVWKANKNTQSVLGSTLHIRGSAITHYTYAYMYWHWHWSNTPRRKLSLRLLLLLSFIMPKR